MKTHTETNFTIFPFGTKYFVRDNNITFYSFKPCGFAQIKPNNHRRHKYPNTPVKWHPAERSNFGWTLNLKVYLKEKING